MAEESLSNLALVQAYDRQGDETARYRRENQGAFRAQMVAIRLFNERDQTPTPVLYGCVTSGSLWKFMKLEGSELSIDRSEYHLQDVAKILGILIRVFRG